MTEGLFIEKAFIDAFANFSKHSTFQVVRDADHLRTSCGIDEAFMNNIFGARSAADFTKSRIAEVSRHFSEKDLSLIWRVGPSTLNPSELANQLMDFGYLPVGSAPGMVLRTLAPLNCPKEFEIIRVTNESELAEWFIAYGEGFGLSAAATFFNKRIFLDLNWCRDDAFGLFIGRVGGRAVCVGNSYCDGKAVGLYNLTTLSDFRKRGYGTAMTIWCAQEAAKWKLPIYLFSSPLGISVYEKVGFEAVTELHQFYLPSLSFPK